MSIASKVLLGAVGLALVAGAACKSDEFDSAPSAKASEVQAPAEAPTPGTPRTGGLGPVSGNELPPGHPPIGQQPGGAAPSLAPPAMGGQPVEPAQYGKTGIIRWQAPEGWTAVKPANAMRLAEYRVQGPEGTEPAELTVFYFGPGGGGGVDSNLDRWAGQFKDGPTPVKAVREVGGIKVHTVDASGTFDAGAAMGGGAPKGDYRVLGAIAETPEGHYFFKLTGPGVTIAQNQTGFEALVGSFQIAQP